MEIEDINKKDPIYLMLLASVNIYNTLSNAQKLEYMNTLSTWYMREKDILRAELEKEQNKLKI